MPIFLELQMQITTTDGYGGTSYIRTLLTVSKSTDNAQTRETNPKEHSQPKPGKHQGSRSRSEMLRRQTAAPVGTAGKAGTLRVARNFCLHGDGWSTAVHSRDLHQTYSLSQASHPYKGTGHCCVSQRGTPPLRRSRKVKSLNLAHSALQNLGQGSKQAESVCKVTRKVGWHFNCLLQWQKAGRPAQPLSSRAPRTNQ